MTTAAPAVPATGPRAGRGSGARRANDAWEALLQAHATVLREIAAAEVWTSVSMREYDVLYTLARCPDPVRPGELHRHVLLSQPALSRLVDRLVERGLVARCADPRDGRGVRLSLTDAGRTEQQRVGRPHARGVARAVTARLDGDELRQLTSLCRKLAAAPAGEAAGEAAGGADVRQAGTGRGGRA